MSDLFEIVCGLGWTDREPDFETARGVLWRYHAGEAHVVIPDYVTAIGNRAFSGCTGVASVSVPEGVTEIYDNAFADCATLASVTVPGSVTKIGKDAFRNSPATVVCPEGSYAHRYCLENRVAFVFDYQYEAFGGLLPRGFEKLASPFSADEEGPFVFVSYSHRDRELVLPVIKELYENGWRIWYDEGLTIGDSYDETLEAHVRGCSAFLLFVTPNSLESAYIAANEVPWAVSFGKPIVECMLEGDERYPVRGGSAVAVVAPSGIRRALEQIEGLSKGEPREAKGITVVVDPAARGAEAGGGYACCLYSKDGAATAKAIVLEARRAGCALYDAAEEGMDAERIVGCACLVAFLDWEFLGDALLAGILAKFYRAGRDVAVCALEDVEDVDLPEGLAGLEKEHWLVYSHGITADLNAQLARHLQRLGCRDAAVLPGFEYEETGGGIVITKYTGLDPTPRIEAAYGGVPVVEIADGAFDGCVHLKSLSIPNGVREIGDRAFKGCAALSSIDIPDSVTRIGKSAFGGCRTLFSADIPGSVTEVGEMAFWGCEALASVSIAEGVTRIGDLAFQDCVSLASVSIPEGVTEIGSWVFAGCKALASASIAEGVTAIGESAFYECKALSSVSIPGSVTEIGEHAFAGCTALASVSIPDGVAEIGKAAFEGCSALASVSIPAGVTEIGEKAFAGCSALASVSIPKGVTRIGDSLFYGCKSLASVSIPGGVTHIGDWAFNGCKRLQSVSIPEGVTRIGDWAFEGCSALASVSIPDGVAEIGKAAFEGCERLTVICSRGSNVWSYCKKHG
ncbi:MAG: leucine-rich repeat protein, partial [Eggerthellaceae bacterium]|nr:leucine-rich repeat protein [Eggerthellaceae bacterium]